NLHASSLILFFVRPLLSLAVAGSIILCFKDVSEPGSCSLESRHCFQPHGITSCHNQDLSGLENYFLEIL
ncbi:MAG: hypothetical protein OXC02_01510, partial [Rhodobacteraceae bacterium]|nr:hypothetical protein [Paracoccaceae bacterium]